MSRKGGAKPGPAPRWGTDWATIKKKQFAQHAREQLVLNASVCHAFVSLHPIANKL
jgi:hypothetical protein